MKYTCDIDLHSELGACLLPVSYSLHSQIDVNIVVNGNLKKKNHERNLPVNLAFALVHLYTSGTNPS